MCHVVKSSFPSSILGVWTVKDTGTRLLECELSDKEYTHLLLLWFRVWVVVIYTTKEKVNR